ncbi:SemiSWEET transporter [Teredinibacter turnerae]|uniref:SemiSWEET family sugar transporter n=1 Tax=Teredinibacter turnerae TaxID=2426 RepID=UPI00037523D8|nr:SemiSWEET transporter [Teredinibacter turnerae]
MTEVIGLIAACLTTFAFLPQALKVMRTQRTGDLSPVMYAAFVVGVVLWLFYGIMLGNTALILANAVTAIFAGIVFFFIVKNAFFQRAQNTGTANAEPA